jgi:hypothetical protein
MGHYDLEGKEAKDVLKELVQLWSSNDIDPVTCCYLWNGCKYLFRLGRKDDPLKELYKARDYINYAINELEEPK